LLCTVSIINILRPGTYLSGDLTTHAVYLESFFQNLQKGIFYPEWSGNLCAGFGCPMFIFNYSFPYYLGSFFHLFGFGYIFSIKLILITATFISAISMYFLIEGQFGKKGGLVASLLYIFSPIFIIQRDYAVSIGTTLSFLFIPIIFILVKKALSGRLVYFILLTISYILLIFTQTSTGAIVIPTSIIYGYFISKNFTKTGLLLISLFFAIGMSAVRILPALLEVKYTWYNYIIGDINDYKSLISIFVNQGKYGLLLHNNGSFSFTVGTAQMIGVILSIYYLYKGKFKKTQNKILILFLLFFIICVFLATPYSKFIWNSADIFRIFQDPLRILVPISFFAAFIGGAFASKLSNLKLYLYTVFIILIMIINVGNRHTAPIDKNANLKVSILYSEYIEPNNDYYSKRFVERISEINSLILKRPAKHLEGIDGNIDSIEIFRSPVLHEYAVYTKSATMLKDNTYYFPGWKVYINNKPVKIDYRNKNAFGILTFKDPKGLNLIKVSFEDTDIRSRARKISFLFIIVFMIFSATKIFWRKLFN
jgi:hypothetical protein